MDEGRAGKDTHISLMSVLRKIRTLRTNDPIIKLLLRQSLNRLIHIESISEIALTKRQLLHILTISFA
jgi:hypothetical protein